MPWALQPPAPTSDMHQSTHASRADAMQARERCSAMSDSRWSDIRGRRDTVQLGGGGGSCQVSFTVSNFGAGAPGFCLGDFAANLKRETSHAKLTAPENPPPPVRRRVSYALCQASAQAQQNKILISGTRGPFGLEKMCSTWGVCTSGPGTVWPASDLRRTGCQLTPCSLLMDGSGEVSLWQRSGTISAPLCDIPSGCCFFTGPWTVTRSSLRMLRRVAAFCWPLRPVLLLVSFPRPRSPVVGVLGLCWMWRDVPFARQRRPVVGVLGLCWLLQGSFDCFCCPHTSVLGPPPAPSCRDDTWT